MIDYNPARKEIKAAKKCISDMESSTNFDDMEQLWRDCLNHIEKSFTKLLNAINPVKGQFTNAFSKEYAIKGSDDLLRYIKQARDCDNHTIGDISKKVPASTTIDPAPGSNSLYIKNLSIDGFGNMHFEGASALIQFHPESIEAIAVTSRSGTYDPPNSHLGNPITSTKPVDLARAGIAFYENWIEESSKKFK
ncbi:TPA: hypothetical protein ACXR0F_001254 [Klebsiella pneumoniae]